MFNVVIVGNGPAGIGLLSSLYRLSDPTVTTTPKICVIDAASPDETGHLAQYNILSDTRADKFLSCIEGLEKSVLSNSALQSLITELESYGVKAAPLSKVGEFYRTLGKIINQEMISNGHLVLSIETTALSATWHNDHWQISTISHGQFDTIKSKHLVLACGASEQKDRIEKFLRKYGLETAELKSFEFSSNILEAKDYSPIFKRLRRLTSPKVVIVGGSHSAISSAGKLLSQHLPFDTAAITLFHRSPMRVTFESEKDAKAHGFNDYNDKDICPKTGRIYALKGLRLDSKKLLMSVQGYENSQLEERIQLSRLDKTSTEQVTKQLQDADLVISALGYTPNYIPLYTSLTTIPIKLNDPNYVNEHSQLLDNNKNIVPNCYALGLASNYNLAGYFGESSFTGQANGLALWFKDIGMDIANSLFRYTE